MHALLRQNLTKRSLSVIILLILVATALRSLSTSSTATGKASTVQRALGRPPPDGYPPLGLTVEDLEPVFWRDYDPQICVLVSTYAKHGLHLTALLASLISSGYMAIDVILLDTDTKLDSR